MDGVSCLSTTVNSSLDNMKSIRSLLLFLYTVSRSSLSFASTFFLSDNIVGADFYQQFDWESIPDPTNGRVYVSFRIEF